MSGGAAKRAKRGGKAQLSEFGQAVHNAMIVAQSTNVASSGESVVAPPLAQVGEKCSYEPDYLKDEISRETNLIKAKHTAAMSSDKVLMDNFTRHLAGDQTLHTQIFCNDPSLSPLHEACRATIQRVEPKNTFAKGHLKLHKKVLREELLRRVEAIREDHVRREQYLQKQMDELKIEKKFFEDNICERK